MLKIVGYKDIYAHSFRDLNIAWLEKFFVVEKMDVALLNDSKKEIINKGGYIFIALWNDTPAGCFAFIPNKDGFFELGKMAVSENHQGKKIGQEMLAHAVQFAKSKDWKKIILYSSTKLDTALHIYRKFGFQEVPLEKDLPYARSDIKMEMEL
ncbi:GNAT family N-acetyltransferase [Maribacter sp. CXY002]|uniref:GNAT family N-acetyltransferase n=1 Tax=Maribacter luteocoastalis TaxID=3407671 RepID=UPI003B683D13